MICVQDLLYIIVKLPCNVVYTRHKCSVSSEARGVRWKGERVKVEGAKMPAGRGD